MWLSSCKRLGKLSFFEEGKEFTECFSGLYLAETLSLLRSHIQACPASLNSRVRTVCLRALSEPSNTFLGHSGTAHEEASYRSVSERAGCHTDVTSSRSSSTTRRTMSSPPRLHWNPASPTANLEEHWFSPALREAPRVPCGNTQGNPKFPATTIEEPWVSAEIWEKGLIPPQRLKSNP